MITITGTNDAPVIDAIAQTNLNETTDTSAITSPITVTFTDVDLTDTGHTATVTSTGTTGVTTGLALDPVELAALINVDTVTKSSGSSTGQVDLTFLAASTDFDYLAKDEQVTLNYSIEIDDGDGGVTTQAFSVVITGTNDVPVVATEDVTGAVTELVTPAGNLTDSGTISFTDVDLTDSHSIDPTIVASDGALGTLTASVTTQTTGSGTGGVITWNYSVAASAVEYLAKDETKVETFTITLNDGKGGTATQTVTVTITGENDAPVIDVATSTVSGGVTEIVDKATGENVDNLTASGSIAFSDVDVTDTHEATFVAQGVDYRGTFSLVAPTTTDTTTSGTVGWNFSVNDLALDDLAEGQQLIQYYDVTIDDGKGGTATQTVTVTITGTADGPTFDTIITNYSKLGAAEVTEYVIFESAEGNDSGVIFTATGLTNPKVIFQQSGALGVQSSGIVPAGNDIQGNGPNLLDREGIIFSFKDLESDEYLATRAFSAQIVSTSSVVLLVTISEISGPALAISDFLPTSGTIYNLGSPSAGVQQFAIVGINDTEAVQIYSETTTFGEVWIQNADDLELVINGSNATFGDGELETDGTFLDGGDFQLNFLGIDFAQYQVGTAGSDTLVGSNDMNDTLDGAGGDDILMGLDGDDLLIGGAGDDILIGGPGADVLRGGPGSDTFVLDDTAFTGVDTIEDYLFVQGGEEDIVDITALLDVAGGSRADFVRYDSDSGSLEVDTDGTGDLADWTLVAEVQDGAGGHPLSISILYTDNGTETAATV